MANNHAKWTDEKHFDNHEKPTAPCIDTFSKQRLARPALCIGMDIAFFDILPRLTQCPLQETLLGKEHSLKLSMDYRLLDFEQALYRLDICNRPISLAQTAITSALYGEIFGLKVTSLSYYASNDFVACGQKIIPHGRKHFKLMGKHMNIAKKK